MRGSTSPVQTPQECRTPSPRFPIPLFVAEGVLAGGSRASIDLDRIVVIRLHAFGDVAITFPVLAALRHRFPRTKLTVVTDPRNSDLVRAHRAVDAVIAIDARASRPVRTVRVIAAAARVRLDGCRAILDLQRNEISRTMTRLVAPPGFAAFDRVAPRSAL